MIALASDHAGFPLKQVIQGYLDELGIAWKDFGTYSEERSDYPEFGYKAAMAVKNGECEKGIVICGTGFGISLSANKVKGIRCVLCSEPYTALLSRQHNDSNMLAMGGRVVGSDLAKMIVKIWLEGEFEGGRHANRVEMVTAIENENFEKSD